MTKNELKLAELLETSKNSLSFSYGEVLEVARLSSLIGAEKEREEIARSITVPDVPVYEQDGVLRRIIRARSNK